MPRPSHLLEIIADTRERYPLFRHRRDGQAAKGEEIARFEYTPPSMVEVSTQDLTDAMLHGNGPAQARLKHLAETISRPSEIELLTPEDRVSFPGWVAGSKYKKWDVTVTCDTLPTGDYSLRGFEDRICIDRKSGFPELASNYFHDRERFEREFERMLSYEVALIVVEEGTLDQIEMYYTGGGNPLSLRNSILAWQAKYRVPFVFPNSRAKAQQYILEELVRFAERKERERDKLEELAQEMT